jgi:hypothetical protein
LKGWWREGGQAGNGGKKRAEGEGGDLRGLKVGQATGGDRFFGDREREKEEKED